MSTSQTQPPPVRRRPSLVGALGCATAVVVAVVAGAAAWRGWVARDEAATREAYAAYVDLADQYREAEWRQRRYAVELEEWDDLIRTAAGRGEHDRARDLAREADKQRQNEEAMRAHVAELDGRLRAIVRAWREKWARLGLRPARADNPPAGK